MQHLSTSHSLHAALATILDPRAESLTAQRLLDILLIAVCCLLGGGQSFTHLEQFGHAKRAGLGSFLELPNGIPSHDTFRRVFLRLAPQSVAAVFRRWTQNLRTTVGAEVVALDGKTLRRSFDHAKGRGPLHLVSAWAAANRLVLGHRATAEKSNEITAVPELLRTLELAGGIVTVDALNCQKTSAKEISEADADYVLARKGNHGTAHAEVKSFLEDARQRNFAGVAHDFVETVDKEHGRWEIRRDWISEQIDWFADRPQWEKLRTVAMVEAERHDGSHGSVERRFYLCSVPPAAKLLAHAVRRHWGIENQRHWVLDVPMGEDQCRVRTGHAAENLATLRRIALNLQRRDKRSTLSIKSKQLKASWNHAYLQSLLKGDA